MTNNKNDRREEKQKEESDCSKHKKEVAGISDMKALAEMIGDLHYETLLGFLYALSKKIEEDGQDDYIAGREQIASDLQYLSMSLFESALRAEKVWKTAKPFMPNQGEGSQRSVATSDQSGNKKPETK